MASLKDVPELSPTMEVAVFFLPPYADEEDIIITCLGWGRGWGRGWGAATAGATAMTGAYSDML
jgi:hypothetical protein